MVRKFVKVTYQILVMALICLFSLQTQGQASRFLEEDSVQKEEALRYLLGKDTLKPSPYWPHVPPALFYRNVRENIAQPQRVYQGHNTNFCGYSALTVVLCWQQPLKYVQYVCALYEDGKAVLGETVIVPDKRIRDVAGTLNGKGKLEVYPADQLWLLSLADHFKSYMNIDRKYKPGDENKIWAACTFGKFNRMAKVLGEYTSIAHGADLMRPLGKNNRDFIEGEMAKGTVILFVNSKYLHPSKFRIFILQAPTHFIIPFAVKPSNDYIDFTYWDYGLKTEELIPHKRLKKMTYGITRLIPSKN